MAHMSQVNGRRAIFVSLSAAIFLVAPTQLVGKTGPAASKRAQKTDWAQPLARALQLNSESSYPTLYEACERSDFAALATALSVARSRIAPDKNEFWSDTEFAAIRRQAEDTVNVRGRLLVCQPLNDNEDAPFVYDANRDAFAGEFIADQNVWREFKRTGGYAGQTALGARTRVTTALELEYNLSLEWEAAPAPECKFGAQPGCREPYGRSSDPGCLRDAGGTYKYEVSAPA